MTRRGREHKSAHHWLPQSEYHTYNGVLLPDHFIKFDKINELWRQMFPKATLEHRNKAKTGKPGIEVVQELPEDLLEQLAAYYQYDSELYDKAYGSVAELARANQSDA